MARTISVLVLALACLSAGAATIADADALFKEKRWRKAAKAYEAVASGRGDRGEKLKAAMRAALSHENAGSLKDAEKWADKVIRESAGRSDGETVASAFASKQRILFRRKAKFALRETLLNDAVRRLGWTREVSSLYEKDAFACVKEKNVPAAKKRLSMRKIVLSPTGSNVVAMKCAGTLPSEMVCVAKCAGTLPSEMVCVAAFLRGHSLLEWRSDVGKMSVYVDISAIMIHYL